MHNKSPNVQKENLLPNRNTCGIPWEYPTHSKSRTSLIFSRVLRGKDIFVLPVIPVRFPQMSAVEGFWISGVITAWSRRQERTLRRRCSLRKRATFRPDVHVKHGESWRNPCLKERSKRETSDLRRDGGAGGRRCGNASGLFVRCSLLHCCTETDVEPSAAQLSRCPLAPLSLWSLLSFKSGSRSYTSLWKTWLTVDTLSEAMELGAYSQNLRLIVTLKNRYHRQ